MLRAQRAGSPACHRLYQQPHAARSAAATQHQPDATAPPQHPPAVAHYTEQPHPTQQTPALNPAALPPRSGVPPPHDAATPQPPAQSGPPHPLPAPTPQPPQHNQTQSLQPPDATPQSEQQHQKPPTNATNQQKPTPQPAPTAAQSAQ